MLAMGQLSNQPREEIMRKAITTLAVGGLLAFAYTGIASANEALAKEKGCLNCHAADAKKVGPSLKDVNAKYKGDAAAIGASIAKVSMHKSLKVSDGDVKTLAGWIATIK